MLKNAWCYAMRTSSLNCRKYKAPTVYRDKTSEQVPSRTKFPL